MGDVQLSVSPEWLIENGGPAAKLRLVDLRKQPAFDQSGRIIPGALWRDHEDVANWASQYSSGDVLIVYCVHGHEVSQNAAERLRLLGFNARYVAGGFEAYVQAGGNVVRQSASLRHGGDRA